MVRHIFPLFREQEQDRTLAYEDMHAGYVFGIELNSWSTLNTGTAGIGLILRNFIAHESL